jgi:hypothetical protein
LQACREDAAAGVEAIGSLLQQYPELLHLEDDAGMSLAMLCCMELAASELHQAGAASRHQDTVGLKLLAAGAGCTQHLLAWMWILP